MTATTVISLISAAIQIIAYCVQLAQQRRWIDQGVAEATLASLNDANSAITRAQKARADVRARNERDPSSVMSDDEFRRKDD